MAVTNRDLNVYVRGHDQLSPVLKHLESGVIRFVGAVSSAITAVSALAYPIKAASDFQKQLLEVQKTTSLPTGDIGLLSDALLKLSKQINITAVDLAAIATLGGQLGITEQGGIRGLITFTEEISTAVTALDVPAELAATALGKLINIFHILPEQYRNTLSTINQLSNESTASAEEIFDVLRRIGDLGGSVRVDQASALSALAIDLGLTAETAGTSLTKIFADMRAEADSFARFMGVSTEEWVASVEKDGVEALRRFLIQLNQVPADIAAATQIQLAGGGRISSFLDKLRQQIALGGTSKFDKLLKSAYDEFQKGTSLIREQQNVLSGLDAQFKVFVNNFNAAAIKAGQTSLYSLTELLAVLNRAFSDPAFVAGFGDAIQKIVYYLESLVKFIASFNVDWGSIFHIGVLFGLLKLLQLFGSLFKAASAGIVSTFASAAAGAAKVVGVYKQAQALVTRVKTPVTATVIAKDTIQEETSAKDANAAKKNISLQKQLTDALEASAAKRRAINEQILANEAKKAATIKAIHSAQADAYAVHVAEMEAIQRKSLLDQQRQTYVGIVGRGPDYAQAEAYRNNILAKYAASRQTLEAEHQARLSAISGTGAKERRAKEVADYQSRLAIIGRLEQTELNRKRKHYNDLRKAADDFYAQQKALATQAVVDTSIDSRAAQATLNAARAMRQANLELAASAPAAASGMLGVVRNSRVYAVTMRVAATATLQFNKALALLSTAGAKAIGVLATAVKGFGFIVNKAFAVWIAVDLVKIAAELLGLTDKLYAGINAVGRAASSLFGLKYTPLITDAEANEQAARADKIRSKYQELQSDARNFDREFSGILVGESFDKFSKSLADAISSVKELRENSAKSVEFSVADSDAAPAALASLLKAYGLVSAKQKALYAEQRVAEEELLRINEKTRDIKVDASRYGGKEEGDAQRDREILANAKDEYDTKTKIHNIDIARKALLAEQVAILQKFASGFGPGLWEQVFGGGNEAQAVLGRIQSVSEELKELKKQQSSLGPAVAPLAGADERTGSALSQAKKLETDLTNAEAKLAGLVKTLVNTPSLSAVIYNEKDRTMFANLLVDMAKTTDVIKDLGSVTDGTSEGVNKLFKGLSEIPAAAANDVQAARTVFALEAATAYREFAAIAKEKGEQAKNAIKTSISAQKKELADLAAYFRGILASFRSATDKARLQKLDKRLAESTSVEEFNLNLQRKRDNRTNQAVLDRARADIDQAEARGRYSAEQAEMLRNNLDDVSDVYQFNVGQYYDRQIDAIRENDAFKLAREGVSQQRALFDDAIRGASTYKDALAGIVAQLRDPSISAAQKVGLIEQKDEALTGLTNELAQAKSILQSIAGTDPIAGKLVVAPGELSSLQTALQTLTEFKTGVNVQVSSIASLTFDQQSTELIKISEQFSNIAKESGQSFIAMRQVAGKSIETIIEDLARMGQADGIRAMTSDVYNLTGRLKELSSTNFAEVFAGLDSQLAQIAEKEPKDPFGKDRTKGVTKANLDRYKQLVYTRFDPQQVGEAVGAATAATSPATVKGVFDSKQLDSSLQAEAAKLGPIDVKANVRISKQDILANSQGDTRAEAYAGGGPIFGAGGPTQDKVMAFLSPMEWVVKAQSAMRAGWDVMARINAGMFDPTILRMAVYGGLDRLTFAGGGTPSMSISALQVPQKPSDLGDKGDLVSVLNLHIGSETIRTYVPQSETQDVMAVLNRAVLRRGSRRRS